MPKKQYVQRFKIVFTAEFIEPIIQDSIQLYLDDKIAHFPEWVMDFLLYENEISPKIVTTKSTNDSRDVLFARTMQKLVNKTAKRSKMRNKKKTIGQLMWPLPENLGL